jgi:hypothetical protein
LMFGNRSSTTYVPVIPPITDDTPTLPKVWCESTNTGVTQ